MGMDGNEWEWTGDINGLGMATAWCAARFDLKSISQKS